MIYSAHITSLIVLLLSAFAPAYGQDSMDKVAQAGMQFLKIEVGARAVAMGGSYTAIGQDANAIFWNPAGLARLEGRDVAFSHTQWIADISHEAVAAAWNVGSAGTFGLSFITMNYGDIYRTEVDPSNGEHGYRGGRRFGGEKLGVTEMATGLAYSRSFTDRFSIGAHVKYVHQQLGSNYFESEAGETKVKNTAGDVAVDFGTLYYVGIQDLRFAMSIQHFARDMTYVRESFEMPLTFRVGMAMNVFSAFNVSGQSLTVSVEGIHPRDNTEQIHLGGEYWFDNLVALRAGYVMNHDQQSFSAGAGINYGLGSTNLKVDYAYSDFGVFANVHRFTLGLAF